MKRIVLSFLFIISLVLPLSAAETESQLYTRLTSAYDSGYYPAVLTVSEEFLASFPYSQFTPRVHFIRGKSYFRLSRYVEAAKEFDLVADSNADAAYWQGMAYYRLQNFESAYNSFYLALKILNSESSEMSADIVADHEFSKRSLLVYSAFTADNCGKKEEAASLLEYTLINFNMEEDFQPAVQLLFSIYKNTANKKRLTWLYNQINGVIECFPKEWSHAMLYYMADAFSETGDLVQALNIFDKLIKCDEKPYQAAALQNSYLITTSEDFAVASGLGANSAVGAANYSAYSVLENAAQYFPEGDIQLCDLWMKLAVSKWNGGNEEDAMRCFVQAEDSCAKALENIDSLTGIIRTDISKIQEYLELAGLYEAEYWFTHGEKNRAVEFLQERADPSGVRYPEYMVQLARYSALTGRSDLCGTYAQNAVEKLEKTMSNTVLVDIPDSTKQLAGEAYFYQAYSAAEKKDWKSVLTACRNRYQVTQVYDYPQSVLFAESLLLADGSDLAVAKAMDIFEAMSQTETGIISVADRTKALLLTGKYEDAYKLGGNVRSSDADDEYLYLMGLAATGCGVWKTAETLLGTDKPYGLYYTAYALYRQSRTDEAYPLFAKFYNENMYHRMARNACFYAAVCALQNGEGDNALKFAKLAVDKSVLPDQRMEASVLCASIYNDFNNYDVVKNDYKTAMKNYEEAEKLLEVYAPSSESVSLNLLLSQVYSSHASLAKRNNETATYETLLRKADSLLSKTEMYFKTNPETREAAEEAAYRRAELYYSSAEYTKAADYYEQFRNQYPESSFFVQALFYNALSLKNIGREKEAILLFEKCASYDKYNDTFGFPALRQLIELYRNSMNYDMALTVAERALSEYPEESKFSGIVTTVQNLRQMVEGTDETIAALKTKYEESGRSSTPAGRKNGFTLALEYMNTVSDRGKGENILLDIVGAASETGLAADDRFIIGESYELLGLYYRQLDRDDDATECYLSAAECFASVDKGKAAEVLYNAIDIFVSSARRSDAEAVYRTLVSMDSGSQWAEKAAALVIGF
ncbi:MAG: tetratricopeptide repeat protein [Treponemataceae bacterium]|nr:tetratricopeptide repeat protein [Treponemataceae bacterium]